MHKHLDPKCVKIDANVCKYRFDVICENLPAWCAGRESGWCVNQHGVQAVSQGGVQAVSQDGV